MFIAGLFIQIYYTVQEFISFKNRMYIINTDAV